MAQRDRSQGVGFVYVDLAKLLAEGANQKDFSLHPQAGTAQVINLNRDTSVAPTSAAQSAERTSSETESEKAIQKIKENLDRLQTLHHRLHAVLAELNQVAGSKKKNDLE